MKRIAIYNHYMGCGKSFIASLLANWLEKVKKENVFLQVFDTNAESDICEVVERESDGEGYYIMDFLWNDRIPKAFRYLLKKGMVDFVVIPIQINPWIRMRALVTYVFLGCDSTYENLETKRPQCFCLWNKVPRETLYDKDYKFFNAEKAMVSAGHMVCSSRVPNIPSENCDKVMRSYYLQRNLDDVKDCFDNPSSPEWQSSWIDDLEQFDELPSERKNRLFDKIVDNGIHDGIFTFPIPSDPETGEPLFDLPPDPEDIEATDQYWAEKFARAEYD